MKINNMIHLQLMVNIIKNPNIYNIRNVKSNINGPSNNNC